MDEKAQEKRIADALKKAGIKPMPENEHLEMLIKDCPFLHIWRLGDGIEYINNDKILIGLAPWSNEDKAFLDKLCIKFMNKPPMIRVDIFFPESSIDNYIPGLRAVVTPFVGIWRNKKLGQKAFGTEARRILKDVFEDDLYA